MYRRGVVNLAHGKVNPVSPQGEGARLGGEGMRPSVPMAMAMSSGAVPAQVSVHRVSGVVIVQANERVEVLGARESKPGMTSAGRVHAQRGREQVGENGERTRNLECF